MSNPVLNKTAEKHKITNKIAFGAQHTFGIFVASNIARPERIAYMKFIKNILLQSYQCLRQQKEGAQFLTLSIENIFPKNY